VASEILLIGLNHRTAPVELRERVAFNPQQAVRAAEELRARGIVEEAVVLSTCNRSELYGVARPGVDNPLGAMECFYMAFHQLPAAELDGAIYRHRGMDSARHLFRVAAGLDSMLLGEGEILGQVRQAYVSAFESGATGTMLNRLFQNALEVGKRVRAETELGTRPLSAAFAAVKLAEQIFGNLKGHTALIVGAGAMGEQVVEHMRNRGISHVLVANRSPERTQDLALRFAGEPTRWEELTKTLERPNIVITSVGSEQPILTRTLLENVMAARGNHALFVIDLGVPRNVDSATADLYNLFLYNVDDLQEIVEQNKQARQEEVPHAEAIVEQQLEKFRNWQTHSAGVALLNHLRDKSPQEREKVWREHLDEMKHLSAEDRSRVAHIASDLLDRILHHPAQHRNGDQEFHRKLQEIESNSNSRSTEMNKP
jgi:glutamyl-tRNA reductase